MKNFKDFEIQFVGLKIGGHQYNYHIDNAFFELFEYQEFNSVDVAVELQLEKKPNMLELDFFIEGNVNVNCDVSTEAYDQPVNGNLHLVIKFGEEYDAINEELLIIPHGEYKIHVEQYIYEAIVLAVPYKKVHPGVIDGTLDSKVLDKLEELAPQQREEKENSEEIDPRWNELKKLLKDN